MSKVVHTRVDDKAHAELVRRAGAEGRTLSALVARIIVAFFAGKKIRRS